MSECFVRLELCLHQHPAGGGEGMGVLVSPSPIGVAGSFSEGGQPFCPAKIQSFPAKIFPVRGGQVHRF